MIIPWGTDAPLYHRPFATYALILINVVIFVFVPKDAYEDYVLMLGDGIHPLQWLTGQWLQPRHLGALDQLSGRVRTGRAQPGGQRPTPAVLQRSQAGVGGDPVQPGAHRGLSLEPVVGLPGAQQGFLHQVLGVVQLTGHPVAMRE